MAENYQTTTDAECCHKSLQAGVLYLIYSVFNNQTMNYIRIFNFREVPIELPDRFWTGRQISYRRKSNSCRVEEEAARLP